MDFEHTPVLLNETIEGLNINPDGIYVDCTVGGGGHSEEIIKRLNYGKLIAIDQDCDALEASRIRLRPWENQITFVKGNFRNLDEILKNLSIEKVDGILMDIGVSSHQFDEKDRGFSYHEDAVLDMRMDQNSDIPTAEDIVNGYSEEELSNIFWKYGEDRWSKRIAQFIVNERNVKPIHTTFDLVDVIKKAIPKSVRMKEKHPAKQVFQALRIEVNQELAVLEEVLRKGVDLLSPRGRYCVITFHSLEDRIVKNMFRDMAKDCICPPEFPVCMCNHKKEIEIITRKPIVASAQEVEKNSRSRSAKLRVIQKI